jgi:hypothetical protein
MQAKILASYLPLLNRQQGAEVLRSKWATWRFDIDVYRDGTLIVTTANNGSWPVRTCGLTTSAGDQVVLTKHEVERANLPGYALFIVSDIALTRTWESACSIGGSM